VRRGVWMSVDRVDSIHVGDPSIIASDTVAHGVTEEARAGAGDRRMGGRV